MKPDAQVTTDAYFRQNVGLDISKNKFTACLYMYNMARDSGQCTACIDFPNTKTGFNQMVKWSRREALKGYPLTYLMEPTGIYYEQLAYHLNKINQTVYVVLPNKARSFCEYEGVKTKTDAMDARCLALLGCVDRKLTPWSPPKPIYRELKQMTRLRTDLVKMRTQVSNHIEALEHMESINKEVRKCYDRLQENIDKQLEKNAQDIAEIISRDKELQAKVERISKAKGLGMNTVVSVIAETQGFYMIRNQKQLASYAGLDVVARQSGTQDPKRRISKKGNSNIRAALYMPALNAARFNKQMIQTYTRICQKHPEAKKIGVTAVMRKMLLLIYTLWKTGEEYDENRDCTHTPQKKEYALEYTMEDCISTSSSYEEDIMDIDKEPPF